MPTYIYRREDGSTFEVVQRISEDPLTVDPETGQKVQRVISGAGLIFKGSGFYLTDYKNAKAEPKNGKAEKSESSAEKAKPATAETKPEKPAATKGD
jgi:putative FmdB family regulatory protein